MTGILTLGALGASLSVDAFAASLGKGATERHSRWTDAMRVGIVFGFFEALTPAIGYLLGYMLNDWITSYDHWVAFGLLLAVGLYMVREATLTYSSAVLFSNVVRDYGFGSLVGTGGAARIRQSGGVQSVSLPNTGLVLSYPRFVLDPPSGSRGPTYLQPDDPRQ